MCYWLFFFKPLVVLFKAETVEVLLNNSTTIDKPVPYQVLKPLYAEGLVTSKGEKWRVRRKMIMPSFHLRLLEEFISSFDEHSRRMVRQVLRCAREQHPVPVDLEQPLKRCTLDIICETAMGIRVNEQTAGYTELIKAIHTFREDFVFIMTLPFLRFIRYLLFFFPRARELQRCVDHFHNFTRTIIRQKKEELLREGMPDKGKKKVAFLEMLLRRHLEDGDLTEADILEEVNTLVLAGQGPASMALVFALHLLTMHPEVQELVVEEVDAIFEGDADRPISIDDLRRMKYTERCIKETLRLYPTVPLFGRKIREDIKILDYTMAAGTEFLVFPHALHRDPEVFPDPERFDPDRFLPDQCAGRHPYAYVPFSAGPRNCIGQKFGMLEVKTVLANIFRNMTLTSPVRKRRVVTQPGIELLSLDPLRLIVTPRHP